MHTCRKSEDQLAFIEQQLVEEICLGRVSESFGRDLLPGMYSVPMHTVPKPNSDKLCLMVNHTAGNYLLNSMIDSDAIKGTKLDGLHSLGASLLYFCKEHPHDKLVMFKSDVLQAFHRLPLHPLWQTKQILTVNGKRHIDQNNNFGGHGSPKVWISFMSLVSWIAVISHTFVLLIRSSGYQICYDKLLHSYPVHITLNTAYVLHLVYLPFWYIGYAYFRLCLLIC